MFNRPTAYYLTYTVLRIAKTLITLFKYFTARGSDGNYCLQNRQNSVKKVKLGYIIVRSKA